MLFELIYLFSTPGKENSSPIEIPVKEETEVKRETTNIPMKHKQTSQTQRYTDTYLPSKRIKYKFFDKKKQTKKTL